MKTLSVNELRQLNDLLSRFGETHDIEVQDLIAEVEDLINFGNNDDQDDMN